MKKSMAIALAQFEGDDLARQVPDKGPSVEPVVMKGITHMPIIPMTPLRAAFISASNRRKK